jgi:hypothetical protein
MVAYFSVIGPVGIYVTDWRKTKYDNDQESNQVPTGNKAGW